MEKLNINDIQNIVENLIKKLPYKVDLSSFVTFGNQEDLAKPNIEIDGLQNLHFIIVERGNELERKITKNLDDLLYWIFDIITFRQALDYELQNRNENFDSRRIFFRKQEELLSLISIDWKEKKENEHKDILKHHPFRDKIQYKF